MYFCMCGSVVVRGMLISRLLALPKSHACLLNAPLCLWKILRASFLSFGGRCFTSNCWSN